MGRDLCNRRSKQLEAPGIRGDKSGERSEETGFSGKGGKVLLSRSLLSKKKPYDRPMSSSGHHGAMSLPARLADTTSNAILSSASYLFQTFFKRRRTLWIGNGAGKGVGSPDLPTSQHVGGAHDNDPRKSSGYMGSAVEESCEKAEGEDLDVAQVERVLRRQNLSREQVKRLTEVLQASVDKSESQIRTKVVERSGDDVNPVQLAKAYMGEYTLHVGGIEPSKLSTPRVFSPGSGMKEEVVNRGSARVSSAYTPAVSSVKMLKRRLIADDDVDMFMSREPVRRVRQKVTLNTSPYLRQITAANTLSRTPVKSLLQPGSSPEKASNTLEKPVPSLKGKSIEEPRPDATGPSVPEELPESSKARDTWEVPSSYPEVASLEKEPLGVAPLIYPDDSGGNPSVEDFATLENNVVSKPSQGPLAATAVPAPLPEKTKGFHMSAFFEESSSDEEAEVPAKAEASREVPQPGGLASKEDKEQPLDFISNCERPSSSVGIFTSMSSPLPMQSSVTAGSSSSTTGSSISPPLGSDSLPTTSLSVLTPAAEKLPPKLVVGLFPVSTHVPSVTEKGSQPGNGVSASSLLTPAPDMMAVSGLTASPAVGSLFHSAASPCELEAASTAPAVVATTSPQAPSALAVLAGLSVPTSFAGNVVAAEANYAQSSAALFQPVRGRVQVVSTVAPAEAASRQEQEKMSVASSGQTAAKLSKVSLAASNLQVETAVPMAASGFLFKTATSTAANAFLPVATPAIVEFGKGAEQPGTPVSAGAPPDTMMVANSFLKAGNQGSFVHESPGVDKMAEVDTMATDSMTEESDTPALPPSAPALAFGSASTATTTGTGLSPLFGSAPPLLTSTPYPFFFPSQPSGVSGSSSSSMQFPFGGTSSTPAGQVFGFGTSASLPAASSSFSADTKPNFPFGSSVTTSASTIPASLTFPATSATPSPFAFGTQSSSASLFGAQAPAVNVTSSSAFSFAPSPAPSGAPSFQFGVSGAGTSTPSSQPFAFGSQQPTPAPANPFAQSGAPIASSPFQFGSSAPAQAQAAFPSGANNVPSSTPSPFLFGSQQPAALAPFTFGGQAGSVPSAQPFGFGVQPSPASSAQNPFASPASSGQNPFGPPAGASGMEFAGGFSLGAAGGEKSGRKFIKAKRMGGAKRK